MNITGNLRHGAPALLSAVLVAAGVSAGGPPAMASRDVPGVVMPGAASRLNSVFCTSVDNCWAVGSFDNATGAILNQVLHWTGSSWSQVKVPSPGGTTSEFDQSELNAVRCRTAKNCWAVGDFNNGSANVNQALHWNGSKWAEVPVPNPGGTTNAGENQLFDVVCPGASTCWAAGVYGTDAGDGLNLNQLLRWNGTTWSPVTTVPQPAGTSAGDHQRLNSIRCITVSNCLAVGNAGTNIPQTSTFLMENEALHWNGTKWSSLPITSPGGTANDDFSRLTSLACTSATDCWAAGSYGSTSPVRTSLNQVMHWDGTAWTQDIFVDQPDGTVPGSINELNGITCLTASDCWTVGDYGHISSTSAVLNQTIHWDGSSWSPFTPADPGGTSAGSFNSLKMARCTSVFDCFAVGSVSPGVNQALRWNGTQWSPS